MRMILQNIKIYFLWMKYNIKEPIYNKLSNYHKLSNECATTVPKNDADSLNLSSSSRSYSDNYNFDTFLLN